MKRKTVSETSETKSPPSAGGTGATGAAMQNFRADRKTCFQSLCEDSLIFPYLVQLVDMPAGQFNKQQMTDQDILKFISHLERFPDLYRLFKENIVRGNQLEVGLINYLQHLDEARLHLLQKIFKDFDQLVYETSKQFATLWVRHLKESKEWKACIWCPLIELVAESKPSLLTLQSLEVIWSELSRPTEEALRYISDHIPLANQIKIILLNEDMPFSILFGLLLASGKPWLLGPESKGAAPFCHFVGEKLDQQNKLEDEFAEIEKILNEYSFSTEEQQQIQEEAKKSYHEQKDFAAWMTQPKLSRYTEFCRKHSSSTRAFCDLLRRKPCLTHYTSLQEAFLPGAPGFFMSQERAKNLFKKHRK